MNRKKHAVRREYTAQFYKNNLGALVFSLLSTLLISTLNLWIAWIMQQMIDTVSGVSGSRSLGTLAWCVAGVVIAIPALDAVRYFSKPRFLEKAMTQYKNYAFHKLTRKSIAAFQSENTAAYLSAFSNDAATIETGCLEQQFSLLSNGVMLIGALLMMLLYSPVMTVVACVFFSLPVGASCLTGNRLETAEKDISEKNSRLTTTLKDALTGFSVIKSFKAERAISELFQKSNASVENAKCGKRKLVTIIGSLAGVAAVTAQLGTFLVGGWLVLSGRNITAGVLFIFIDLTGLVINPIRQLPEQLASRKAALALIDKLAVSLEDHIRDEGLCIPNELNTGITLEDAGFGYETGREILHHINTVFEAGKKYAIVGASGSGKSTLLNLLMASHGNYSGEIRYDEYEARDIHNDSLYDIVSMIQQNVFVFNASIRDNITMFHAFPEAEIDRAIELSGLSTLVAERGRDYLCGENGSNLSGGEKQRIAIARSLLKKAKVLLVDEATAALDAETAHLISDAILGLEGVTTIAVTHSLEEDLLRRYDGILALKNGSIIESGAFEDLIAKKGYFYSLFMISQ